MIGLRVLESGQIGIYLSPICETIVRGHRIAGVRKLFCWLDTRDMIPDLEGNGTLSGALGMRKNCGTTYRNKPHFMVFVFTSIIDHTRLRDFPVMFIPYRTPKPSFRCTFLRPSSR